MKHQYRDRIVQGQVNTANGDWRNPSGQLEKEYAEHIANKAAANNKRNRDNREKVKQRKAQGRYNYDRRVEHR